MKSLRDWIDLCGIDQVTLAERIGCKPTQLSHWLSGRRSPNARNLKRIADATGIRADRLLEDFADGDSARKGATR